MNWAFSDEQRGFAGAVREILARACPPSTVRAAWLPDAPLAVWPHLARASVTTMTAPERDGGLGLDALEWVLVAEECGRAALPEPLVEHVAVAVPMIAAHAPTGALRDRALAPASVIVVALDDAPYVPDAARADLILLARGPGRVLALERHQATIAPRATVDGARRLARVTPRDDDAGTWLEGVDLALAADRGATAAAAQLVGLGRQLLDTTVAYVQLRTQFGRAVGSFQAVKHHLADAHVALELARPAVHRAAHALAHREPDRATHVSLAKSLASDAAQLAARAALQCHGAIGYSFEHDLHLWLKRVWALAAAWGDAAFHRARLATHLLGVS